MVRLKGKAKIKANKKERNKKTYQMAIKKKAISSKIRKYDDPILKETCDPVNLPDEEVITIAKEMEEVLRHSKNGVGLSASQIGYNKRMIAVCLDKNKIEEITIMLNPSIINKSDDITRYKEGCLSYPDFYTVIERPVEIEVMYETINGEEKKEKFSKFQSVVICHEIDHTQGVCKVGDAYYKEKEEELNKRIQRRKNRK